MKKEINYVDAAKFETILKTIEGVSLTVQKGFVKVSGKKGRNVYIALTKTVGRVDLSGFEFDGPGVVALGDSSFGSVTQQMDFTLPEEDILSAFEAIVSHMASLEERVIVRKARERKESDAEGWSFQKA